MERSDMTFRKSSYSGGANGACVEVGTDNSAIMIRDTTNRDACTLAVSSDAWSEFVGRIK